MSDMPIFEQLQAEFIKHGKFCGLLIGPPVAKPIVLRGAPKLVKIEPEMDDTIVFEPVKEASLIERIKADETQIVPRTEVLSVVEEEAHVFPIRKPNPHKKNSANRSFSFFGRAA